MHVDAQGQTCEPRKPRYGDRVRCETCGRVFWLTWGLVFEGYIICAGFDCKSYDLTVIDYTNPVNGRELL